MNVAVRHSAATCTSATVGNCRTADLVYVRISATFRRAPRKCLGSSTPDISVAAATASSLNTLSSMQVPSTSLDTIVAYAGSMNARHVFRAVVSSPS